MIMLNKRCFPRCVFKETMEKGDFYTENCTPPMVMVIEE